MCNKPMEKEKSRGILNKGTFFVRNIKKKFFFLIALCLPFLIWQYSQIRTTSLKFLDQHGTEHVLSLSVKDKKRLFSFMQMLFTQDSFAYTLLGSKPVSWASYHNPFPFSDWTWFCDSLKKYSCTMRSGWKTWKKYRHLFPSANFWAEAPKCHPGSISILIVNEERFNNVVNNNKKDFQDVLHRNIADGLQLLREAKNRSLMNEVLEGHQALLGIVLGYGRDNSWEFLRRSEKREFFKWVWDEKNEEKPGEIVIGLGGITIEECLELDSLPSFAGDPHSEESMALKKDYLQTQQRIINYYKDKDFLEATLSLLAGYRPKID